MNIDEQYIWLFWSLILIAVWLIVYALIKNKESRREMFIVSLWTSILGLTEPIFVPEYWNPPSLFDLARRTGFDLESLIFSFAIGGLAVVLYELLQPLRHQEMTHREKHSPRHRYHLVALLTGSIFFILLIIFAPINPIYSAIIAMVIGGTATWWCRPDLKNKMFFSAAIFTLLYFFYFETLNLAFPGYVEQIWNLKAISNILILDIPIEELLFAAGLGFYWSSIFEHLKWKRLLLKK